METSAASVKFLSGLVWSSESRFSGALNDFFYFSSLKIRDRKWEQKMEVEF